MRIKASELRLLLPLLGISRRVKTNSDERRELGTEITAEEM
jgi:hypothetical protein